MAINRPGRVLAVGSDLCLAVFPVARTIVSKASHRDMRNGKHAETRTVQRARLYQLFNSNGPWKNGQGLNGSPPAVFHQTFANSGELAYCSGLGAKDCLNDGLEYDKNGRIADTASNRTRPRQQIQYRLGSGELITIPDEFEIGHRVWLPREHNSTLLVQQAEAHVYDHSRGLEQFDHMEDNLYMQEDFIERRLS